MAPTEEQAWNDFDRAMMSRALALAQRGLFTTDPNPRVGCVLVQGDSVVGEGYHQRAGEGHAEVLALGAAGSRARGATAYVTLEPCSHHGRTPPCTEALIGAGVARVVYGLEDPNPLVRGSGAARLREAGVAVAGGLMGQASAALNCGFVKRMTQGMPFVRVKLAMSLDGRTGLANGASRWITSDTARKDSQQFRARSSVVLTGVGTVLADDPAMNVRVPGADRQPLRVVLDTSLRTPPQARVLHREGAALLLTSSPDPQRQALLQSAGARVEPIPAGPDGRPQLSAVLGRLAQLQANEVWVEAGAQLAGAFVRAGLYDELVVYVAPSLLGGDALPLLALPPIDKLEDKTNLKFTDFRSVGEDLRLTLRPA